PDADRECDHRRFFQSARSPHRANDQYRERSLSYRANSLNLRHDPLLRPILEARIQTHQNPRTQRRLPRTKNFSILERMTTLKKIVFIYEEFEIGSPAQQLLDRFLIGYPRNGE